jgi:hypothetical protein
MAGESVRRPCRLWPTNTDADGWSDPLLIVVPLVYSTKMYTPEN